MMKKIVSLAIVLMLVLSMTVIAVSAEQVEVGAADSAVEQGAEAVADQGADAVADQGADASADTSAGNSISFDANSAGWKNFKKVYCHVWAADGTGEWPSWQSKAEQCTYDEASGIATYDLSKTGNEIGSGANWACIFSNENGMQTFNLLFGSECFGDTAYCDGTTSYENPSDSTKTTQAAFWKNQDKTKFGPCLTITSIGNVVGTCCPGNTSPYKMMVDFLVNTLENARQYSGKSDQDIIDDAAAAMSLKQGDVTNALKESGVSAEWDAKKSKLDSGENEEAHKKGDGSDDGGSTGDNGGDSGNSGDNGDNGGSGDNSGSSGGSGSSSGSSSKTGTAGGSTTGQSTTVLFIALAALVLAAGVIVILRRRQNSK